MDGPDVRRCPCRTRLARDHHGSQCARCVQRARDWSQQPPPVPAAFWNTPEMRAALSSRHMGQVIRVYRTHPHHPQPICQDRAAGWLHLTQTQLSRLETGPAPDSLSKLTHWARVLGVPPDLLWFALPGRAMARAALVPTTTEPDAEDAAWQVDRSKSAAELCAGELDDMNRRELLRLLSLAGPLGGLADWPLSDERLRGRDGGALEDYAALNAHLWQVFVLSRSKPAVFPLIKSHLDTVTTSLQQTQHTDDRRRLCVLAADLFQLAGEVCFDANHYTEAAHCYTLAASASREADAFDLWACALVRHAFIALRERAAGQALPLLELAGSVARRGNSELSTRHWVAAVQAQAFASLGDLDACEHALDQAQEVHDLDCQVHNGGWLRFDGSRLAEERGTCYVSLRRPDLAEAALTAALGQDLSARRRGSVLVDLALIGAQRHDRDQLLAYALPALDTARDTASGYLARRLHELRSQLGPLHADPQVRQLDQHIVAVTDRAPRRRSLT